MEKAENLCLIYLTLDNIPYALALVRCHIIIMIQNEPLYILLGAHFLKGHLSCLKIIDIV